MTPTIAAVLAALGLVFIAAAVVLLAYLAVTHRPDPDPYDQPHREVEPWPMP